MDTSRLEVQANGEWKALDLKQFTSIKYNKVINKIGKVGTREISHSNTFSLPISHNNTNILGLNSFNYEELALALNKKSVARYFLNDKITQVGFVVINNMDNNSININFIDGALDVVDKWSSISYKDFLQSDTLLFPSDYLASIDEMKSYVANKTLTLSHLSEVGTRGYNLGLFPNNLNCIGEDWQLSLAGNRVGGTFNPYQSRTIWNTKAFLDLIIETYGYTANYDASVDWDNIEKTYFTSEDSLKNSESSEETSVSGISTGSQTTPIYSEGDSDLGYEVWNTFMFSGPQARKPNSISFWSQPPIDNYETGWNYENRNCIYYPNINNSTDGYINLSATIGGTNTNIPAWRNNVLYVVWFNSDVTDVIYNEIDSNTTGVSNNAYTSGSDTTVDFTIQKSVFDNPPSGTSSLVGIMLFVGTRYRFSTTPNAFSLSNMQVSEESLLATGVTYDEFGQFVPDNVDLTYSASRLTLKDILNSIMETKGLLIDINATTKDVTLFSYGAYLDKVEAGVFEDWTNYLLEDEPIKYNTNYGNDYAIVNKIGLSSPYLGNTFSKVLTNQGVDSKYKPFVKKYDQNLNDVIGVQEVVYPSETFLEFETGSIALVEDSGEVHNPMVQVRADTSNTGNISNVPKIFNVNMAELPNGLNEWYNIIDSAVRVKCSFLISPAVFVKFDIKQPIYLRQLGGYFIVEEIEEYESGDSPVKVTLIKLLRNISD